MKHYESAVSHIKMKKSITNKNGNWFLGFDTYIFYFIFPKKYSFYKKFPLLTYEGLV